MRKAFLSHIFEEAPLAKVIKSWVEETFAAQVEVFVSSESEDLPAGSRWLDKIDSALENSEVLIILCSPRSIHRPWINFEAGCGWIKKVPIIPVCHSGLSVTDLPQPLASFQGLSLEDGRFAEQLLRVVSRQFEIKKYSKAGVNGMQADLRSAQDSIRFSQESPSPSEAANPGGKQPWVVRTSVNEPALLSCENFRYRVERSKSVWTSTWQVDVMNKTRGPARYRVDGIYYDSDGFPLEKNSTFSDVAVAPNEKKTLKDRWAIPVAKAQSARELEISVQRRP